jgi:hypothetical protein
MNILVAALTIGALIVAVVGWRSRSVSVRRVLTGSVLLVAAYMAAWVGAGFGLIPRTWVTDHPIAIIGAWSLAVVAIVGSLTVSRFRATRAARSIASVS